MNNEVYYYIKSNQLQRNVQYFLNENCRKLFRHTDSRRISAHAQYKSCFRYGSSSDSAIWMIGAAGAGRDVVYNMANLIGVDPSIRIPLCMIL